MNVPGKLALSAAILAVLFWAVPAGAGGPKKKGSGLKEPGVVRDTAGIELSRKLTPRFSPGGSEYDNLIVPGAKKVYEKKLIEQLFSRSALMLLNAGVDILPPDDSAVLFDEPVEIIGKLLSDGSLEGPLKALVNLHRDGLILPLSEFSDAAFALDMETRQRLLTHAAQDFLDLLADERIPKVLAGMEKISRADLDGNPKTSPDVANAVLAVLRTLLDIPPDKYDRSMDLFDILLEGGFVEHFQNYAEANKPFAGKESPIVRLTGPLECLLDPAGSRGLYRAVRTQGIIAANYPAREELAQLVLENVDRFTEPKALQMIYNVFRYPRLPQLVEGFHIGVEMDKFDPVIENIARIAAGEATSGKEEKKEGKDAEKGTETASRDDIFNKFADYMKSGQRTRLVMFMTGQALTLLTELGDVRLKSEPNRTLLNESISLVTYLLAGDSKLGIPPVVDPLLDAMFDILVDEEKGERFIRVISEASKIILDPPSGLDVKDMDNQFSDILKCDPALEFAAVARDLLDDDPKNGDIRPAVPIFKLLAKTDPSLVALSMERSGEVIRKGQEVPLLVLGKRILYY